MHKTIMLIFIVHMFVIGLIGIGARLYIAGFLLSSESTESSKPGTRFFYRYLIFWTNYMLSFMVTPAIIIKPIFGSLENVSGDQSVRAIVYVLLSLPLAILLYWLERRLNIWGDERKRRGIEEFKRKFGPKE